MKVQSNRIKSLDFLRGFAILYIVGIHHMSDYVARFIDIKIDYAIAYLLLGLFVFMSGYLLNLNTPRINNIEEVIRCLKKRFLRIYPLYFLALVSFYVCSFFSFKDLILHLVLFDMILGKSVFTLWFVSMICLYYLIMPIIVMKYSLFRTILRTVIILFLLVCMRLIYDIIDQRLIIYLPLFVFGIISAKHDLLDIYYKKRLVIGLSFLICIASFILFELTRSIIFQICFMTSAIPFLISFGQMFSTLVDSFIFQKIAYASFCMYLYHRIIYFLLLKIYSPEGDTGTIIYLVVVGIPLIYYFSNKLQKYYDRMTISWRMI